MTNADFFMTGYDCKNADFVANLSTHMDLEEKNEDVRVVKSKAQIIQNVADTDRVSKKHTCFSSLTVVRIFAGHSP